MYDQDGLYALTGVNSALNTSKTTTNLKALAEKGRNTGYIALSEVFKFPTNKI